MNEQFLVDFEPYLIDKLNQLKGQSDAYKQSASYDTAIQLLEQLVVFINKYKQNGDNMTNGTKIEFGDLIDLDKIPRKSAAGAAPALIKEASTKIPKGKAMVVKMDNWGTFSNAVVKLKERGELGPQFRAQKRGDVFLLRHE